ncbi:MULTISPECIES: extracellular catalytic domain type 1 short-chain-length polyhydroxyalkanoate depolymerase [unclassified Bradyrhizobium]|uniref:extracellular catalytic domain type 1 short-chain-length polyhydroxyalkanoate depolymerase n=1 Tax=unclassified Bradyrhizobium TaxID=2631580 RepID=UPI00211E39F9|nr:MULTISPECIES: PHB depolymerase family esterase [unclassified Bradyrhizobium]MDD1532210.1 esterase [Bradyrhizobium sp. WBOS8]MDD1583394.1 esterase [Bradyrhizobium sp. WBOS4]UUO46410.1 esterase [Bradyrhizobium sp. WBOS04]UUO59898.1 esterase [Bradyrhizobium sp. WBOS08]
MSLAKNIDLLRRLPRLDGLRFAEFGRGADTSSPLQEVTGFGDNPGALRMFAFVPARLQKPRALVVVLHGCGQTAAAYDLGAGWSTLAQHYGFALLMPEQQRINNGNTCFNWFNPEDTARGSGEAHSIREMIAHMVGAHRIDPARVFITGLSAGGGMTSVMLATYPEVFAAGAVIAGLPYGIASNLREALEGMFHSPVRPARELGDLVRNASDHRGPWPKISVWHGSADRTVNPGNANEIVKQWLDLHDLPDAPMAETIVDGHPRQAWWGKDGETLVECYAITDMAHGTPLGLADNDQRYGAEGAFLIEAGISSSYHIAKFFGLTAWIADAAKADAKPADTKPALSPAPHLARTIRAAIAEQPAEPKRERARGFDLSQIITRALTAAGLMK